jgi:tRNA uridine 5-carboxymethylaminomethyl modification enzyme
MVEKMNRLESVKIDDSFDFRQIHNLSSEAKEKLSKQKPATLGQAARISGISPADVSVLMVHLGR